jgi:hypothetical protein
MGKTTGIGVGTDDLHSVLIRVAQDGICLVFHRALRGFRGYADVPRSGNQTGRRWRDGLRHGEGKPTGAVDEGGAMFIIRELSEQWQCRAEDLTDF